MSGRLLVGGFRSGWFWSRGGDFSEKHGARGSLIETNEFNFDFLAKLFAGVIDNNHCAVTQVGNALVRVTAGSNDFDFCALAGEILITESEGEDVQIECINMLSGGDFREIVVIGQD